MSYTVEFAEVEGILTATWYQGFDFKQHITNFVKEIEDILDAQSAPVYLIHAFDNVKLSFSDIISGASMASRGEASVFHHKMVKQVIFVTSDRTLRLAAKGLNNVSFGFVSVKVFETLDEALDFIRSEAA